MALPTHYLLNMLLKATRYPNFLDWFHFIIVSIPGYHALAPPNKIKV